MKESKNTKFKCGLVNTEVLKDLQQSFETMEILDAVDLTDEICASICDPEEMRFDLLRLHGQAHALINGDYRNASVRKVMQFVNSLTSWKSRLVKGGGGTSQGFGNTRQISDVGTGRRI